MCTGGNKFMPVVALIGGWKCFRAKWVPVRVKKTRQNKKLEPGSDPVRTRNTLA
jgi:hypothetical protein